MRKNYTTPSYTVMQYDCCDIITASVQDDNVGFNLGWIDLA